MGEQGFQSQSRNHVKILPGTPQHLDAVNTIIRSQKTKQNKTKQKQNKKKTNKQTKTKTKQNKTKQNKTKKQNKTNKKTV